jgi:tRNA pseudouridine38-40 synthase
MPTFRLTIEYDGSRYRGWQEQPNARTVAGELRAALARVLGAPDIDLAGAGRTDAGVHALAQVAHLRLTRSIDRGPFRRAVNDALPADIAVLDLAPAPDSFDARRDAVLRSYLYQVATGRPGRARYVWRVGRPLDVSRMAAAARACLGRRDFSAFCERPAEQASTLVHVERAEIAASGNLVLVRLAASHFLWKMARRLVGAFVRVGAGEWRLEECTALLAGAAGGPPRAEVASGTAPATGLFLERVLYLGDPPLGPLKPAFPDAPRRPGNSGG